MCNLYEQYATWEAYCRAMQAVELGVPSEQTESDLPAIAEVRIGDMAPVMRSAGNIVELAPMRFAFPPSGRGGPVFNFRSEGRHFDKSNRCLVPATAFFEFTGTKYPKTKHRFTLTGEPFLAIAAIWREGKAGEPSAFAMLTTEPGPDVAPYHARQIVVLPPGDWAAWLYLTRPENELLRPLPAGSLSVETVRKGKD